MELEDNREVTKDIKSKSDWGEYRKKTKYELPKKALVKLLDILKPGKAIELGPGSGTDTLYLLENGWDVLGIDYDLGTEKDIRGLIQNSTGKQSKEIDSHFSFINDRFENLRLEKECCDLVVGFNSLFFCRSEKFKDFFQNITASIKPGGYLLVNLLGKNDDWNKDQSDSKTFLSREEIIELLKDFEIDENVIKEIELDKETAVSKALKHWHTFFVCAKKK